MHQFPVGIVERPEVLKGLGVRTPAANPGGTRWDVKVKDEVGTVKKPEEKRDQPAGLEVPRLPECCLAVEVSVHDDDVGTGSRMQVRDEHVGAANARFDGIEHSQR